MDPDTGPVQRFAHELRSLRREAGAPSYRTMAQRTGLSVTTLSRAASGERLPASTVVRAYAQACGADPDVWERRWREVDEEVTSSGAGDGGSPYPGRARFEQRDRALFFGRDRHVDDLLKLVVDQRFAVLLGRSGSGKSSLLRAGLLPQLDVLAREKDCAMEVRLITPGARPCRTHGRLLDPSAEGPERFVVVDQLEEIFTLCRDRADRWGFVERLLAARDSTSRLRVVVAVGGGFRRLCAEHEGLASAMRDSSLTVRPMTRAELQDAVVRPATAAGLRVERELTARIVEEAFGQPGALPMLSQALHETWRRRRSGVLTVAAYEATGGIHGVIAEAAEEAYRQLSPTQAATARRLLLALIAPGDGTPDTRRRVSRADLREWPDPEVPTVLERLSRARLITIDEEHAELAHEALITAWPRLQGWIDANRERLHLHRRLTAAARIWQEHGRSSGYLVRGAHLALADVLFRRGVDDDLAGRERAFLSASRVEDRMERWKAGRTRRRARILAAALCFATAGGLFTSWLACRKGEAADLLRTRAVALEAAGLADRTRPTDPRTAALLSVAAWRLAPSATSRAALFTELTEPQEDVFTGPEQGADERSFLTGSGRTLLTVGAGAWSTWDVVTHRRTGAGAMPDEPVLDAAPDGADLLLNSPGGQRLWRLPAGSWARDAGARPVVAGRLLGLGADGHSYVVRRSGRNPEVQLRSVDDGKVLFETARDLYPVPSQDDRLIALCRRGQPVEVWDVPQGRPLRGAWGDSAPAGDCSSATVAFGAGGARLAVVTGDGIRVWDTGTGRRIADFGGPGSVHPTFTSDGRYLAAGGTDGVTVWRISAPRVPVFSQDTTGEGPVDALAWDPARPTLRCLVGGAVRSLDLSGALVRTWRERPLDAVLLSPDGRLLAVGETVGDDYRIRVQDLRTGRRIAQLSVVGPKPDPVRDRPSGYTRMPPPGRNAHLLLAFSPDSRSIAYGLDAGSGPASTRFVVRDVSGRGPTSLDVTGPPGAAVHSIALTARGRSLLVSWSTPGGGLASQVWDTTRRKRLEGPDALASAAFAALASGYSGRTFPPLGPSREADDSHELAVSADGAHLAEGGALGTVTVRDGVGERRIEAVVPPLPATARCASCSVITALAFSPDGRTLAVAYGSGQLRLWDLALNQPLGGGLGTSGDTIDALSFGADGSYLYAAGRHIGVQTYAVRPSQVAARLCARAGRTLSMGEWHRYLPDAPYRRVCPQPETGPDGGPVSVAGPAAEAGPAVGTDDRADGRTDVDGREDTGRVPASPDRIPWASTGPATPANPGSPHGPKTSPASAPRSRPHSAPDGERPASHVPGAGGKPPAAQDRSHA
ncbi:helix-turn-helix domain-containing protein [Streptomyces griseorubiginosus]|uniref:nSTAND1 domain-containing NTPase n=1 Tax=Streptomyces griseorubiginosus TaxID=67304 RepID=UPI0036933883